MSTALNPPLLPLPNLHIQTSTSSPIPEALAGLVSTAATADSAAHLLQLHAYLLRNNRLQPRRNLLDPISSKLLRSYSTRHAARFFTHALHLGFSPNEFAFSIVLKRCVLHDVRSVHGMAVKHGLGRDCYVGTGLIDAYAVDGELGYARRVFDGIEEKSLVSATAMMGCYSRNGEVSAARDVFDKMSERDVVCWNVMIDGYTKAGMPNEALRMFRTMLEEEGKGDVRPNEATLVSVLNACSEVGALELGTWVHSYVKSGKNGIRMNVHLGTALVDMYSKCGSLENARLVFEGMKDKDTVAWNSMIWGYASHGFAGDAFRAFDKMREFGLNANGATFIAILTACANSGLVKEGWEFFDLMKDKYGIEQEIAHYGCMVNLLCHAGRVKEAFGLVRRMRDEPDSMIWGTLLFGCSLHGQTELGEEIGEFLLDRNTADTGTYILLSNIYAASGNWKSAVKVRKLMKSDGVTKEQGHSSIEVDNRVHDFLAGDKKHPKSKEIYGMLEEIGARLKSCGYKSRTDRVLHDLGQDKKEQLLEVHSERLAIAFGLLSSRPGTTIRIVKNLRVCPDCHVFTKFISKITGRQIIMRDRSRFHHFEDGSCSCGDYW